MNSSTGCTCGDPEDASESFDLRALALLSPVYAPARPHDRSRSSGPRVVELLRCRNAMAGVPGGLTRRVPARGAARVQSVPSQPDPAALGAQERPILLRRLLPPGQPVTVPETVEELGLWQRAPGSGDRGRMLVNMVSTVDGRAA